VGNTTLDPLSEEKLTWPHYRNQQTKKRFLEEQASAQADAASISGIAASFAASESPRASSMSAGHKREWASSPSDVADTGAAIEHEMKRLRLAYDYNAGSSLSDLARCSSPVSPTLSPCAVRRKRRVDAAAAAGGR